MELLQLRYFLESAKTGSFAKAAEKYMVPASSVSASIRRLEQELGQRLFSRTANRIALNQNGQRFLKTVSSVLSDLDQAVNDVVNPPDQQVIRMLVLSYRHPLTNLIIAYRKTHPGVAFELCIDYKTDDLSQYDIIVGTPDPKLEDYAWFDLCDCQVFLQVTDTHPLCDKTLTLAQLQEYPFVTMGGNMHEIIISACKKAGFTPNIIATVNDTVCYKKIMLSGDVIGHCRNRGNAPGAGLSFLNVVDFNEHQKIRVYYKAASAVGSIKNFLEFLKTTHV